MKSLLRRSSLYQKTIYLVGDIQKSVSAMNNLWLTQIAEEKNLGKISSIEVVFKQIILKGWWWWCRLLHLYRLYPTKNPPLSRIPPFSQVSLCLQLQQGRVSAASLRLRWENWTSKGRLHKHKIFLITFWEASIWDSQGNLLCNSEYFLDHQRVVFWAEVRKLFEKENTV